MTRILLHGCHGTMGQVVASVIAADAQCTLVAGIDPRELPAPFPTFRTLEECEVPADVLIDFSTAEAVPSVLAYAVTRQIPAVVCTTGLSDAQMALLVKKSNEVALLKSANMSVGVNLILQLVKQAAKKLAESNFDIEIIEKHHNRKIDAPSGTALALADAINEAMEDAYTLITDRSQMRCQRDPREIGMHAVRGGSIVGEHTVLFAGQDEIVELKHIAASKEIFAVGAVRAAKYLAGKPAGFYTMQQVME